MKSAVLVTSIILCLLFVSSLKNYTMPVKASSKVIVPDDYPKIQWAVDNATDGDTIFVRSGPPYYENIVIDKSITLIGEDRNSTIIDGSETGSVIFIKTANNVNVQNFTLRKSGTLTNSSGVLIERSSNILISNNTILTNYHGISLFSASNTVIRANDISENFYGISLYWSTNNLIENNNVSSNAGGISLDWSSNNVISANTIVKNSNGAMFTLSSNNTIYDNNFDNTLQVWSYESMNSWSYDGEGNYWSDYNGTDFYSGPNQDYPGSDGIGDVPYFIDETNDVDSSPLMGMFRKFDIPYKGVTYSVTIISNSSISDFQFQIGTETGNKIICFRPMGNESSVGFCRIMIPVGFMRYPYVLLLGNEEIIPTFLNVSNEAYVYLYFTYSHKNQAVTIISSELYSELLGIYYNLNMTYYNLLNTYNVLLYNYTMLLGNYTELQDLNVTFYNFLDDYSRLQEDFQHLNETYYNLTNTFWGLQNDFYYLNVTYYSLLNTLVLLLGNYTQLQENYQELNASYQDHLRNYSENVSNVQNLTYILAATTTILIVVTAYLSKRLHSGATSKTKRFEDKE